MLKDKFHSGRKMEIPPSHQRRACVIPQNQTSQFLLADGFRLTILWMSFNPTVQPRALQCVPVGMAAVWKTCAESLRLSGQPSSFHGLFGSLAMQLADFRHPGQGGRWS